MRQGAERDGVRVPLPDDVDPTHRDVHLPAGAHPIRDVAQHAVPRLDGVVEPEDRHRRPVPPGEELQHPLPRQRRLGVFADRAHRVGLDRTVTLDRRERIHVPGRERRDPRAGKPRRHEPGQVRVDGPGPCRRAGGPELLAHHVDDVRDVRQPGEQLAIEEIAGGDFDAVLPERRGEPGLRESRHGDDPPPHPRLVRCAAREPGQARPHLASGAQDEEVAVRRAECRHDSRGRASEELLQGDPGGPRLLGALRERIARILEEPPPVPRVKALLSRDGGVCPDDGAALRFDPWSPERHTCGRCGKVFSGERHQRHWARPEHLWLAERAADLALLSAVDERDDPRLPARALELLQAYEELYQALPNRDNVLGPSHLFFSTYLESLWLTSYLAAAFLLQEAGLLPEERAEGVNLLADEAAALIGDFNEGFSNRQIWHTAALTAIAAWFGDEELARTAVESRTGLLGLLADGFGEDGLWWEGENYHLFALRGLMQGMHWARTAGFDLLDDPEIRAHFRAALLAPARSALPDFTFPARRDSRYGVSLAQPAYLELWEIGRAWLGPDEELDGWLAALYALPAPPTEHYDAWLHVAGRPAPARWTRGDLSWWALASMGPPLETAPEWRPASVLLADQGLAVLRAGECYASLECGPAVGGHGHPDPLHLP